MSEAGKKRVRYVDVRDPSRSIERRKLVEDEEEKVPGATLGDSPKTLSRDLGAKVESW